MVQENISSKEIKNQQEYEELKNYLKQADSSSEHVLSATWRCIKHMQSALDLPSQIPIKDLVNLFNNLEETRKAFNFQINTFTQLNELFHELRTVGVKLKLSEKCTIREILSRINPEIAHSVGLDENSLLIRLLQIHFP